MRSSWNEAWVSLYNLAKLSFTIFLCGSHLPEVKKDLRCERLISKYKRKDSRASAEAQQKARARCEQRGKLMHFDWKKGFGFITPDNRQPGSDIRRQGIFFHIRDWKCSSTFPDKQTQLPLPVRFNRQPSNRAQGGRWRAVQVSRLGGAKAHLPHGSAA